MAVFESAMAKSMLNFLVLDQKLKVVSKIQVLTRPNSNDKKSNMLSSRFDRSICQFVACVHARYGNHVLRNKLLAQTRSERVRANRRHHNTFRTISKQDPAKQQFLRS